MFNQFFKKTRPYIRISAALILAVGLWVGLSGQCIAAVTDTTIVHYTSHNATTFKSYAASDGTLFAMFNRLSPSDSYQMYAYVSTDNGSNWSETKLSPQSSSDQQAGEGGFVEDSSGNVYAFWAGETTGGSYNIIRYSIWNGDSWSAVNDVAPSIAYSVAYNKVVIDSNDDIYVFYRQRYSAGNSNNAIKYVYYNGASWSAEQILTASDKSWSYVDATISNDDNLYVIYNNGTYVYYDYRLSGGAWHGSTDITGGTTGPAYSQIVVDGENHLHCVWQSGTSPYAATYAYYDGSNWSYSSLGAVSNISNLSASISVDYSTNYPTVIFIRSGTVYYRTKSISGWSAEVSLGSKTNFHMMDKTGAGYAFVYIPDNNYVKFYASDGFTYYNPESASISITYPAASSTSKADYWTTDIATNISGYDKLYVKVKSASTEACAENTACTSAWVDGNKVIGECDGVDSTFENTSNVSRLANIPDSMDGETVYATAYLYGVTDATCVDGDGPEVPVLLATSDTISFTYSIDYITDLSDADEYWAASWADRWGAATSTMSYQAVAGGFDLIMAPVVNWASGWSHLFNTADATDAGISAGSGIQVLMQHAKDFFNVIPGCQLFAILLIAIIIDIAIYIYKNIYRIKKFFTV